MARTLFAYFVRLMGLCTVMHGPRASHAHSIQHHSFYCFDKDGSVHHSFACSQNTPNIKFCRFTDTYCSTSGTFNDDIGEWDVSAVTNMESMYTRSVLKLFSHIRAFSLCHGRPFVFILSGLVTNPARRWCFSIIHPVLFCGSCQLFLRPALQPP